MPYLFYCTDGEGAQQLRQDHIQAHLAYVEGILERMCVAGPLRDAPGSPVSGSCFIFATESRDEALRLLQGDPYYQAGVFAEVSGHHLAAVAGEWVGGKLW